MPDNPRSESFNPQLEVFRHKVLDLENFTVDNITRLFNIAVDNILTSSGTQYQSISKYITGQSTHISDLAKDLTNLMISDDLTIVVPKVSLNIINRIYRIAQIDFKLTLNDYLILETESIVSGPNTHIFGGKLQEYDFCQINTPLDLEAIKNSYSLPKIAMIRLINTIKQENLLDEIVQFLISLNISHITAKLISDGVVVTVEKSLNNLHQSEVEFSLSAELSTIKRLSEKQNIEFAKRLIAIYPSMFSELELADELM